MRVDPNSTDIRWRLHLSILPGEVYPFLATDDGRARFWAESARATNGVIILPISQQSDGDGTHPGARAAVPFCRRIPEFASPPYYPTVSFGCRLTAVAHPRPACYSPWQ
jgi:hypothetical protein